MRHLMQALIIFNTMLGTLVLDMVIDTDAALLTRLVDRIILSNTCTTDTDCGCIHDCLDTVEAL